MRCAAGVGLLVLVGCNQIFSLKPTREFDASTDVIPDVPHVVLDYQVASVLPSGAPDPVIAYVPISPAPDVRISRFDDMRHAFDAFASASYSPSDGWIMIPRDYVGATWRLEYTINPLDGSPPVTHEVQWAPEDKMGHLTVPIMGRLDRDTSSYDGGYVITPANANAYSNPE